MYVCILLLLYHSFFSFLKKKLNNKDLLKIHSNPHYALFTSLFTREAPAVSYTHTRDVNKMFVYIFTLNTHTHNFKSLIHYILLVAYWLRLALLPQVGAH